MNGEHKITSSHRERAAICYLRQSSMAQVRQHTESTRSQYALADTAAALGWPSTSIEVIDTDLGISGKWGVAREGFTELVTRVCTGEVGAMRCSSRLSGSISACGLTPGAGTTASEMMSIGTCADDRKMSYSCGRSERGP